MRARIKIAFKDGRTEMFAEGDFYNACFASDLNDRNTEFVKIGEDYVKKSEILFAKIYPTTESENNNEQP